MKVLEVLLVLTLAVLIVTTCGVVFRAFGQEAAAPRFSRDAALVEQEIDSQRAVVREWLETKLTQAQLDDLEATLFPAPTDDMKRESLLRARRELQQAGLERESDVYVALEAEIEAVPAPIEEAPIEESREGEGEGEGEGQLAPSERTR